MRLINQTENLAPVAREAAQELFCKSVQWPVAAPVTWAIRSSEHCGTSPLRRIIGSSQRPIDITMLGDL